MADDFGSSDGAELAAFFKRQALRETVEEASGELVTGAA